MDFSRYSRQVMLPEIGEQGQKKLSESSVLIVGAGGLGSPAAIYLAAAGVGHITIADADEVRLHNLNRQILYREEDLGFSKVERIKKNLHAFNKDIDIEVEGRIDESNIYDILNKRKFHAIVDGTDNFETRYIMNNASIEMKLPYIYGSVLGWEGQVSVFDSREGPCYQCVYPEQPNDAKTCVEAGVLGTVPGVVGAIQANQTIKTILEIGDIFMGKMIIIDLLNTNFKIVEMSKDPHCGACA